MTITARCAAHAGGAGPRRARPLAPRMLRHGEPQALDGEHERYSRGVARQGNWNPVPDVGSAAL